MKYAYEDLSDKQFEDLIVLICQRLLGMSVQGFAEGPDGGRDAKFEGTANAIPSEAKPWEGKVIVQAKHTNGVNKSFSETDFYSEDSKSCIVAEEIPRIQKLISNGELDHYILFSNRRLTGNTESIIRKAISEQCNLPSSSIKLYGLGDIELWLKIFDDIPEKAKLDPLDSPLVISPDELAEIVELIAENFDDLDVADMPPVPRTAYDKKNELNNMSDEFADNLRKRYLKLTPQISHFLGDPNNSEIMQLYESIVEEFQDKIVAKKKDYHSFDELWNYLLDILFARDAVLRQRKHKKITRTVLFYMYWNCDIGKSEDVASN